jgi:hypothetical protein
MDDEVESFIFDNYGKDMLKTYHSINPSYGSARTDLFRYLLLYKVGGIYLDIKSTAKKPFDDVLYPDDHFVICQWHKPVGRNYSDGGAHPELSNFFNGEFQTWNIISEPNSPFLSAVIDQVLTNIQNYNTSAHGVGARSLLLNLAAVMYTKVVGEMMKHHPHRLVGDNYQIGLQFSVCNGFDHRKLMITNYTICTEPLIL